MKRVLTAVAFLSALSTGASAGTLYSRHGWWSVDFETFQTGEVLCQAGATYRDGTHIAMGAMYSSGGDRVWGLKLSNPAWKWINKNADYIINLSAPSGPKTLLLEG